MRSVCVCNRFPKLLRIDSLTALHSPVAFSGFVVCACACVCACICVCVCVCVSVCVSLSLSLSGVPLWNDFHGHFEWRPQKGTTQRNTFLTKVVCPRKFPPPPVRVTFVSALPMSIAQDLRLSCHPVELGTKTTALTVRREREGAGY